MTNTLRPSSTTNGFLRRLLSTSGRWKDRPWRLSIDNIYRISCPLSSVDSLIVLYEVDFLNEDKIMSDLESLTVSPYTEWLNRRCLVISPQTDTTTTVGDAKRTRLRVLPVQCD